MSSMNAQVDAPGLRLAPDLQNVRVARSHVLDTCRCAGLTSDLCDTVVLLTSEIVTNAFLHGRSGAVVRVGIEPGHITVAVSDDNSRKPVVADHDDDALDGRGLAMVEIMSTRWGVREDILGKTVWFMLDRG